MKNKNTTTPVMVLFFMVFIAYIWCTSFYNIYTNGAKIFFIENRWYDITHTIPISLKEELIWRCIPFMGLSIAIILLRSTYKNHKKILHTICALVIVIIQIFFGYAHYLPGFEDSDWAIKHIILQGFAGICFSVIYSVTLHTHLNKNQKIDQLNFDKKLLMSHFLAFIASSTAHILFNTLIIINQTF